MRPLAITHYTVTSALGLGKAATLERLLAGRTGLAPGRFDTSQLDCWIGVVPEVETRRLEGALAPWDCRNNRLAQIGLGQDGFAAAVAAAKARYGAERVGVFIGTSTSGIQQTELAYRSRGDATGALPGWFDHRRTQSTFSAADFVRTALDLRGVCVAISTACSSSAKVFGAASRAIAAGLCDAAVVGGVDSLCLTTLYGFNSLQLISSDVCRPADARRAGLSIGEAAGFALVERPSSDDALGLLGYGESSDAHHMSAPEPEGRGALAAMREALDRAGCAADEVDYINLHGTGTPANDSAEDRAVYALFGDTTPCSSTKGWTGHTLGAAGIVEAVIGLMCIEHGVLPRSLNTREKDPALRGNILLETRRRSVRRVLSNSFGFGGNNCSLLLGMLS